MTNSAIVIAILFFCIGYFFAFITIMITIRKKIEDKDKEIKLLREKIDLIEKQWRDL